MRDTKSHMKREVVARWHELLEDVALSHCQGRNSIRLLRDFDEKLLTTHPCEFLRDEEERLETLDEMTKQWWIAKEERRMTGSQIFM